jgi:diacylglycerol kinase
MKNRVRPPYSLPASFLYAAKGIFAALKSERNLRIHCAAAAYALYFSRYFSLSRAEYGLLVAIIGIVFVSELINTAVEAAVDLKTHAFKSLAQTAKDAAAGAVLISAVIAAAVGALLFRRPDVLKTIWADITASPGVWIVLFALTVIAIALPDGRKGEKS